MTELVGIVCPKVSLEKYRKKFSRVAVFDNLRGAIKEVKPHGVIVSSPNDTHLEMLLDCALADIPVLLEKPALLNIKQYNHIITKVPEKYLLEKVLVGHHRVHSNQLQMAKSIINSGRLGALVAFSGRAVFYKPDDYFAVAPWRSKKGGGPLLINLIHEIQTMRLLIGEIQHVSGVLSHKRREFDVEDTAAFSLMFENGTVGNFLISDVSVSPFSWEMTSKENPAYPFNDTISCYEIFGDHGTLTVPDLKLYEQSSKTDRSWWKPFKE